jgi:hypothetical protein
MRFLPPRDWAAYRQMRAMDPGAAERGRLMTAQGMACDPERRAFMEAELGEEFCRRTYPEAYRRGFAKLLDRVREAIPW